MPRLKSPLTASPPVAGAKEVRALRSRLGVSQSALSTILNVSVELVQAWEAGRRVPRGAALRLLEIVRSRPDLAEGVAGEATRPIRVASATDVSPARARVPSAGRRSTDRVLPTPTLPPHAPAPSVTTRTDLAAAGPMELLRTLVAQGVAFVTVGGVAARLRGAQGRTDDLDIVYDRSPANLVLLATFLKGIQTTLRGAPGTIPFAADPRTLAHTAVLALDTKLGPLDLRQRIAGIGDFAASLANSTTVAHGGRQIPTLTLDALIVSKRATGRSKDREEVRALEALR